MKFSKFNLIIKEGNKRVLFNTLSGECFKISTGVEEIIDNNLPDQLNKELYDDFLKKGIIVDDQVEENRYFSYIQNQTRFNNSVLSATVLLTWACNLACIYCYEGAGCRTTRMNKATADRFIGFMINQAKARNSKSMYINLFGGEPLLNIECGFYILDALKKFCAEKNIEFASGIITNGTLLTAEIVSQLINYNCQQIQITLDGMPDTHNARRKYKDGKGSFEQIISALELLNNKCADIHTVKEADVMSEHREGTLFYDTETGRYDIRFDLESFYGGLHCGECFDVKVKDVWVPVRIEMGDDWYLVGLNVSRLDGLRVRM